ncbi:rod shape-determining protein MreC [Orenia marismortui]|uniref:rod shape-determining protein MreC n=1 Tax=Orenia marismortui TaxID=46469 RepID=UPI00037B5841|nr:rod shape-determining protein MreC [Orenia marismortui]
MFESFKEHHKKILIIVFVVILIRFINLVGTDRDYNKVEGLAIDLLKPAFVIVDRVKDFSKSTFRVVLDYQRVKEENEALKDKLDQMSYLQQQMEKIIRQNQRLRESLNFKKYIPYKIVGASVIAHSADNWSNVLIVDRGSKVGIKRKMPVVAKNGYLIGIVQQVTAHTSQILLINDSNFVTGGLVRRDESRDLGIVKGQAQDNRLIMNNLSWDADIKIGDIIVTSGLSQYYPKGLPIGKVISVSPDNYGLTQLAMLNPFVEFDKIEEVLIITDFSTKKNLLKPLDAYPEFKGDVD